MRWRCTRSAWAKQLEWNRVRALVDVTFSNSKIEAWWRSLKHQWPYLNHLNTVTDVRRLTQFYVEQHNGVMPHAAFDGQTPDEMYYATGADVVDELKAKRQEARRRRVEDNRVQHVWHVREHRVAHSGSQHDFTRSAERPGPTKS